MLKLDKDDPQKELEFEVKCALMHTPKERLKHWYEWNLRMLKWREELHGHKDKPKLVKRNLDESDDVCKYSQRLIASSC